jgi:hypothetical protein
VKLVVLPEAGEPKSYLCEAEMEGERAHAIVKDKKGKEIGYYYFTKKSIYDGRYPSNPFLGIRMLTVPVPTIYCFEGNANAIVRRQEEKDKSLLLSMDSAVQIVSQAFSPLIDAKQAPSVKQMKTAVLAAMQDGAQEGVRRDITLREAITRPDEPPLVTSDSIVQIINRAFLPFMTVMEEELAKYRDAYLKALRSSLNKNFVYIGIILIGLLVAVDLFLNYTGNSTIQQIARGLGIIN